MPQQQLPWKKLAGGYSYHAIEIEYKGVLQKWKLVFSEQAYSREINTLEKNLIKLDEQIAKDWWHLSNKKFKCQTDALSAAKLLAKSMSYHKVTYDVEELRKHSKRGRPTNGIAASIDGYKISYTSINRDEAKIAKTKSSKGRFILATNELDSDILPTETILKEYKAQSGVDRGFKFIKDNAFQVDSVFLKKPSRIESLMMVMTLCLMVYGVTQYKLRTALKKRNETLPDQKRNPTQKPSLKWIYFLFSGVQEWTVSLGDKIQQLVVNVNDTLKQIVSYFGPRAQAIYLNPS